MQPKLARLCKLAKARAQGEEGVPCTASCHPEQTLTHVVDTLVVDAEDMRVLGSVDEKGDVSANVL
jgi:hypothetical protein